MDITATINTGLAASMFLTVLRGELLLRDPVKFQEMETRLGRTKRLLISAVSFAGLYLLIAWVAESSTWIVPTVFSITLLMCLISYFRLKRVEKKFRREAELHIADADKHLAKLAELPPITDEKLNARILQTRMKLEATRAKLKGSQKRTSS